MLLMKLKVVCVLAVILTLGAGGVGWSYRAGAAPPAQAGEQAKVARSLQDELEELRLEVAALRKGLESTRQRVKELENEARAARETGRIQAREQATPLQPFDGKAREAAREREKQQAHLFIEAKTGRADLTDVLVVELLDPLADIEAALKQLRAHPDDKKAAEKLMRAAKTLKDGQGPPAAPPSRNNPPG